VQILWSIIIGFIVGLIARALMPGRDNMGLLFTTLLGIAGALIAQLLGQSLGWYAPGEPAGFLAAVIGAMVLLAAGRGLKGRTV
jgi:uncharacterized membrane protein YeaQ/YmgE (transglycosylase-associated protein family)